MDDRPINLPPFFSFLGLEVAGIDHDSGQIEIRLPLRPHHKNSRGVAHGGVITALLDSALGGAVVASIPREWWCATIQLSTQFVAGPRGGMLRGLGRVVRRGGRVAFAEGEVRDDEDRLIATAHGSWHLWTSKPGTRPAEPGTIFCIGRNYDEHVREMGAPAGGEPVVFLKPPRAWHHGDGPLAIPTGLGAVHHEVELVAVIGRGGRAIAVEDALPHVAGYAVGIDLTLRDVQQRAKQRGEPWSLAKGFDGAAPVSAMVSRDEVGDGSGLEIELQVDGETRQRGNTSMMIHGVAALVAHCSRWMTLSPGDLIFTGTPAGVGPVTAGDRVEARIERVGELRLDLTAAD